MQKVALELFAEQGYEKTSLREIAERLGVTKAALYYHFKSKEDIVHSFTDDYFAELDALLRWAKDQPPGDQTRLAVLDRTSAPCCPARGLPLPGTEPCLGAGHGGGQGALRPLPRSPGRARGRARRARRPAARPGAATSAVLATGATCMFYLQQVDDPDKLRAIVLEIATDLIS